jgi:hypothetical protein
VLLPGQRHDITSFDVLMAGIHCLALIGDTLTAPNNSLLFIYAINKPLCRG